MRSLLFGASFITGMFIGGGQDSLGLREAVEIIAEYDIQHVEVPAQTPWWGITDFDGRKIWIVSNADLATRRLTAAHELIHVSRRLRGLALDDQQEEEAKVRLEANKTYRELFGR